MATSAGGNKYLVALDLDRTLLSINSSRLVVLEARKRKYMEDTKFFQALYFSVVYKLELMDPAQIVLSMMKWIQGLEEQEFVQLMNHYAIDRIIESIRPEMETIIGDHHSAGARVILLSSAMPYICDPVAEAAGLDDVVCSRLGVENGRFTGSTVGPLVFGPEKAVKMKAYCEANGFRPEDSWYYGDAYTDRFVLEFAGNPVCVEPERRLRRLARKRGWQILL